MVKTRRESRKGGKKKPKIKVPHQREALLGVVVGRKGIGKTHITLEEIEKYSVTKAIPRRALILDVNNEFTQYPTIALKDITHWCSYGNIEIRRISIFKATGDDGLTVNGNKIYKSPTGKMTLNEIAGALYFILKNYFVGLLLIEDINKYTSDHMPNDLVGAICTQRHVGVDIIIHFQNIGRFGHPKIVGNANWLRFHKVSDTVKRHKDKFEDIVEPLSICEIMVNTRYRAAHKLDKAGRSFYVYWDADDEQIKGNFSKKEYIEAVEKYLTVNARTLVNPVLKEEDLYSGKLLYPNRKALIDTLIKEKVELYYGN